MLKIMSFYHPQWMAYAVYLITVLNAFSFPIYGLIFSKIMQIMLVPQAKNFISDRNFWCGMFIILCFGMAIFGFLNKLVYAFLGENLTYTVRNKLFAGILYKHLAWFDNKERAPGILSNTLSEDITHLNGLTSESIAVILEAALTLIIGIILSFIYTWKMALVTLSVTPLVMLGGIIMSRIQWKHKAATGQVKEKG